MQRNQAVGPEWSQIFRPLKVWREGPGPFAPCKDGSILVNIVVRSGRCAAWSPAPGALWLEPGAYSSDTRAHAPSEILWPPDSSSPALAVPCMEKMPDSR
jgi:hypothetical protein